MHRLPLPSVCHWNYGRIHKSKPHTGNLLCGVGMGVCGVVVWDGMVVLCVGWLCGMVVWDGCVVCGVVVVVCGMCVGMCRGMCGI